MKRKDCRFWGIPNRCLHEKNMDIVDHRCFHMGCPYTDVTVCNEREERAP